MSKSCKVVAGGQRMHNYRSVKYLYVVLAGESTIRGKREKKAILFFRAATKERLSKIVVCVYPLS